MTSPTLVPASQSGSNRFTIIAASGSSSSNLPFSAGSSENSGSRPSVRRTCRANVRYSKLMAAAGSKVGAMLTVKESLSETRQHMPFGTTAQPKRPADTELLGI
eukprot:CAMPEP_0115612330 /NCGR_PEP_ID=MMETSP0272-20121206/20994_1 /TAXON_ID=71861 /ORGANISM="Scrippsiella trochoidea, Strain CCMP3099" /LENGTH=103 /DNA_ID=CAMNT_0003048093 /DNA_START=84 /DNA_END=392 /DNA_ORIENTATION=-